MQQIVNFIIRNKAFLLFLLLFVLSLVFTIQSHSYHKSKFINSANFLSGGVYNTINNASQYLDLKSQNELLAQENNKLKALFYNTQTASDSIFIDSFATNTKYKLRTAHIIKNSYNAINNVLLLDKGLNDSIKQDYGVITTKGIVGVIDNVSGNYATVVSILNSTNKISGQLKKTNHFGSLIWNGVSPNTIQLIDVEKIAPVLRGDTVITSGRSSIFPKGIPVGVIKDFKLDAAENYYEINVTLFNDMTNIEHVQIIENKDIQEITNLLNGNNE